MYLITRAWKQKAFDFCCWTGRQTPKWFPCLLLPAPPQMKVLESKWFTPQFSIPELNLIKTSLGVKKYSDGEDKTESIKKNIFLKIFQTLCHI